MSPPKIGHGIQQFERAQRYVVRVEAAREQSSDKRPACRMIGEVIRKEIDQCGEEAHSGVLGLRATLHENKLSLRAVSCTNSNGCLLDSDVAWVPGYLCIHVRRLGT